MPLAAVGLVVWLAAGCLNPRPEEDPSANVLPDAPAAPAPVNPVRESCDDNPLLAGCSAPASADEADNAGSDVDQDEAAPASLGGSDSSPAPPESVEAPDAGGSSEADAGDAG